MNATKSDVSGLACRLSWTEETRAFRMTLLHYVCCMIQTFPVRQSSHSRKCKMERHVPGTSPAVCPQEEWPPPRQKGHVAVRAAPGRAVEAPGWFYLRGGQNTKPKSLWYHQHVADSYVKETDVHRVFNVFNTQWFFFLKVRELSFLSSWNKWMFDMFSWRMTRFIVN